MTIIDPALVALLDNFHYSPKSRRPAGPCIGAYLVASLCRSASVTEPVGQIAFTDTDFSNRCIDFSPSCCVGGLESKTSALV